MTNKLNFIKVKRGEVSELAEKFNVSRAYVSKALAGKIAYKSAIEIRQEAIKKHNGIELAVVYN